MTDKYKATGTPFLSGFENYKKDGDSIYMNFILSNGDRSTQRDEKYPTDYTHKIPKSSLKKIRRVTIHNTYYIWGFSFFDKDRKLLWKHGYTKSDDEETVEIAENERIIGVKAKLQAGCQSWYTDWQFQIGKLV